MLILLERRSGAKYAAESPYSDVFEYFEDDNASEEWQQPPQFPSASPASAKQGDLSTIKMHLNCPHQDYDCSQGFQNVPYTEPVYLLAEATQVDQWATTEASIESQLYPHIKTVLASSIPDQNASIQIDPLNSVEAEEQLCKSCGHLSSGEHCDNPADPDDPRSINDYWTCVCSLPSTEEQHYHSLLSSVTSSGWIFYLPSGHSLRSPNSIAHLLAQAKSTNEVLLFSNTLTPFSPTKQFKPSNVKGIGLMHHSSNMWYSRWNSGKKCGKWRTLDSLASRFPLRWVDDLPVVV